jgi:hypothetical protein
MRTDAELTKIESDKAPARKPLLVEETVKQRIARGHQRLHQIAPERQVALEYWRGNQYWHTNQKGILTQQLSGPTGVRGPGKSSWRVREPHNMLIDIVAHEVSASTARVPNYEVVPTTGDPDDASAAKVAERVARYGYDKWGIRDATVRAVTHAVVTGEAFAWVYWDSSIGPFISDEGVGVGDVCVEIYGSNQVYWEPGQHFDKSDWHAVDVAMTPEAAKRLDGYIGPDDLPKTADIFSETQRGFAQPERRMTLVTYYLERPNAQHPAGRWKTFVGDEEICHQRDYPGDGQKPCIHRLSYIADPDSDRDFGLILQLLPAMRQFNDATNKIMEWKNLHMMGGRIFITPGLLQNQQLTDEPGQVVQIMQPNENVKVQEAPPIPQELFQIRADALAEMARIAAQNDIPTQVESGKGIVALTEKDTSRRGSFFAGLAEWHARVMRSCLIQVQDYYDEDRTLHVLGHFGWESLADFQGSDMRSNCDVRVFPASLEPLTRELVEQRVIAFADRQWISPEAAMHAINTGTAENLIKDMELAEARVHRIIRRIKEGPQSLFAMPTRTVPVEPDPLTGMLPPDPETGLPMLSQKVPGWCPLPWDNLRLWRSTFETWFSTEEAETLPPEMQEAANIVYAKVLELEAQEQMKQAMAQQQMAAGLGMANAASPQGPPSMPDMAKLGEGGNMTTPNQPASQNTPS